MQTSQKILMVAGFAVLAVVAGGVIGWWGGRDWGDNNPSPIAITAPPSSTPPVNPPPAIPKPAAQVASTPTPVQVPDVKPVTDDTNWEDRVQTILDSEAEDEEKVKLLFALFPKLPEDGQVAVAEHLTNLVEDEHYAPLGQLLKDTRLPVPVLDVIMNDALSRPDSMKLPLMLDIAKNPAHAKAAEAKEVLENYLDQDYGNDWPQWQQKLTAWLKDNPD